MTGAKDDSHNKQSNITAFAKRCFLLFIPIILLGIIGWYFTCFSHQCDCRDRSDEETLEDDSYSVVYDGADIQIIEKHLNESGDRGVFDIDLGSVSRVKQASIDTTGEFHCEWKGKEVDNYVTKESICQTFDTPPSNFEDDGWIYYKLLNIREDQHTSQFKVFIDEELVTDRELKTVLGSPIQAVKFIDNQFVVDFQTNEEIIYCTSPDDVCGCGTVTWKGYYSSIWVNGDDVLNNTQYDEAFSPYEMNEKLLYFMEGGGNFVMYYDKEIVELPYDNIPHYGCCEESQFNIVSADSVVDFFGRKDDGWYHVKVISKR